MSRRDNNNDGTKDEGEEEAGLDGLAFKTFKLTDLGAKNEDGITVVDELMGWVHKIAGLVTDDRFTDSGSVTLVLEVNADKSGAVVVQPKVTIKRPKKRHMAAVGFMGNDGKLKVQSATQPSLPGVEAPIRLPRAAKGGDEPGDE